MATHIYGEQHTVRITPCPFLSASRSTHSLFMVFACSEMSGLHCIRIRAIYKVQVLVRLLVMRCSCGCDACAVTWWAVWKSALHGCTWMTVGIVQGVPMAGALIQQQLSHRSNRLAAAMQKAARLQGGLQVGTSTPPPLDPGPQ